MQCSLFINDQHPFLHATADFQTSWDCCGLGCGEVKCPICIKEWDFDKYVLENNTCLEKVNGIFPAKKATQLLIPSTVAAAYLNWQETLNLWYVPLALTEDHK